MSRQGKGTGLIHERHVEPVKVWSSQKRVFIALAVFGILVILALFIFRPVRKLWLRENGETSPQQEEEFPYGSEKADGNKRGVTIHIRELTCDGYNLFYDKLIGMQGNVVHSWPGKTFVRIMDNGDVIACRKRVWRRYGSEILGRYTWEGKRVWEKEVVNHHEIFISEENTIFTPGLETHSFRGRKVDFATVLGFSDRGREVFRWSTWDKRNEIKKYYGTYWLEFPADSYFLDERNNEAGRSFNFHHLNSLQTLPENPYGKTDRRFRKGNLLMSFNHQSLVFILDRESGNIVWVLKPGITDTQHTPRMLKDGNILIFDNGMHRGRSRVIEVNPITQEIVWCYGEAPHEAFFSMYRGSAQRLPDGNTLIVDSEIGRAFEVTGERQIVWEYFNPEINEMGRRQVIYRMLRYPKSKIESFLNRSQER